MQSSNFRLIFTLQILLLLYDLVLNSIINLVVPPSVVQLVLFILQDICIVFELIILFLEFFNTYAFQAGFGYVVIKHFRISILVSLLYLGLSIGLHVYTLTVKWDNPTYYIWIQGGFYALFIIQRGFSPLYYYYYKRSAMALSDSKFYYNSEWLKAQWTDAT